MCQIFPLILLCSFESCCLRASHLFSLLALAGISCYFPVILSFMTSPFLPDPLHLPLSVTTSQMTSPLFLSVKHAPAGDASFSDPALITVAFCLFLSQRCVFITS